MLLPKILLRNNFVGVTNYLIELNSKCSIMVICEKGDILENCSYEAGLDVSKVQFCFLLLY